MVKSGKARRSEELLIKANRTWAKMAGINGISSIKDVTMRNVQFGTNIYSNEAHLEWDFNCLFSLLCG